MESEVFISVNELARFYGQHCAIKNVSFNVRRGEILGFLGPNGAGKSTTMQIVSGILAANHGSVSVAGHDINETPKLAKQHLGFLPEQPPLYNDLTVDEYLAYTARLRGIAKPDIAKSMEISKRRCGLEQTGPRLINNLSKGYRQRVGIAQAIIHSPAVIILDEPTAGLDPIQVIEIRKLMQELALDHSIILSTHILSEVQSLCSRVLIINEGQIVFDQTFDPLKQPRAESVVIGLRSPPTPEALLSITGVAGIDSIDTSTFRVHFNPGIDATDAIIKAVSENDWGLYKLNAEDDSLEAMFLRLICRDEPVARTGMEKMP